MNSGESVVIGGLTIGMIVAIAIVVFFFIAFTVGIVLLIVFLVSNNKHKNFAIANSKAINQLKEINKKYQFLPIKKFEYKNTYDNIDFYDAISCKDYLIYQLQFKQKDAWKEIEKSKSNRELLNQYSKEIADSHLVYGKFNGDTSSYKMSKLIKYEKAEVKRITFSQ